MRARCSTTHALGIILAGLCWVAPAGAIAPGETNAAFHARMRWWNEGRLGLFLHWGVYSTFAGEYGGRDYGKEMGHTSAEWIYLTSNMPPADYRRAARGFDPVRYDPNEWVRQAQAAGMAYIVLTAKHHDGFALFDTEASEWDAVDAGCGRDLFRAYVDACHAQGMKVGFYYSHEKDWTHHARRTRDTGPLPQAYVTLVRRQLTELLTRYGRIDLIWFDTPVDQHADFNRMCAGLVRRLQPHCIINGRIGSGLGDYRNIGDRAIVAPGQAGYLESIMTMRLNWGYDRNDDYWKPSAELIRMVSQSACRGSNFLLNIGPTPAGTFPPEDRVRLHDLGAWMQRHGEAIHGTQGSPYRREHPWGSLTTHVKTRRVYLHLSNWQGGPITLHGLLSPVERATLLDSGQDVATHTGGPALLRVDLPQDPGPGPLRIVRLQLTEPPRFDLERGPTSLPPRVQHTTARLLRGRVTEVDGIRFTLRGRLNRTAPEGYERDAEAETTETFSLNDHVRYRRNDHGDLRSVQGFDLVPGQELRVVYDPKTREVEIVTAWR